MKTGNKKLLFPIAAIALMLARVSSLAADGNLSATVPPEVQRPEVFNPQTPTFTHQKPIAPLPKSLQPVQKTPPKNPDKSVDRIGSQNESFKTAAEASSYVAHYMSTHGPFAERNFTAEKRAELGAAMNECLMGSSSCDEEQKDLVLKALIHYNLGKEVRSMIIENRTNEQNMRILNLAKKDRDQDYRPSVVLNAKAGGSDREAFKVDPNKVAFQMSEQLVKEREIMGPGFVEQYRDFIDTYSRTTGKNERWHFVAPKNMDEYYKEPNSVEKRAIDRGRFADDMRSQEGRGGVMQQHVTALKKDVRPVTQTYDSKNRSTLNIPYENKMEKLGLFDPDRSLDAAKAVVKSVNKDVDLAIAKNRMEVRKTTDSLLKASTYNVNVDAFGKFLDEIWPPSSAMKNPYAQIAKAPDPKKDDKKSGHAPASTSNKPKQNTTGH